MADHEETLQFEYDDKNSKATLTLARFGERFGFLRLDEKSIFKTLLGFTPW